MAFSAKSPAATLAVMSLLGGLGGFPALAQQRIVTLSPSLTEAVCALGRCAALVGTDRHSSWPERVHQLPRVGGLADAQIENIVLLRPDLVLLGPRSRAEERLLSLGIPVQKFDARTHADLRRTLQELGRVLGTPARAADLVRRIDDELLAAARNMPASLRGRSVYVEVGGVSSAASAGSFIGETVAALGLVNIVPAEMGLFPKINPEMVVRRAPDLIIAPQSSGHGLAGRPGWGDIPAVRQGQVCLLDDTRMDLLSRPGPRVGEAAHMLVDCLLALPGPQPSRRR
jgi:iron complex transport system substrate-binding protein